MLPLAVHYWQLFSPFPWPCVPAAGWPHLPCDCFFRAQSPIPCKTTGKQEGKTRGRAALPTACCPEAPRQGNCPWTALLALPRFWLARGGCLRGAGRPGVMEEPAGGVWQRSRQARVCRPGHGQARGGAVQGCQLQGAAHWWVQPGQQHRPAVTTSLGWGPAAPPHAPHNKQAPAGLQPHTSWATRCPCRQHSPWPWLWAAWWVQAPRC